MSREELFNIKHGPVCQAGGKHYLLVAVSGDIIFCRDCRIQMTGEELEILRSDLSSMRNYKEVSNAKNLIKSIFPETGEEMIPQKECTCPTLLNGHWDGCPMKSSG